MKNNKGFTLIEMLVVVAIVGLLASVVVVGVGGARQKARDAKRISDVRSIQNWAEANYSASTGYPSATDYGTASTGWLAKPSDPGSGAYTYTRCTDPQAYYIKSVLELPESRPSGYANPAAPDTGCTACIGTSDYCVTSQ
jgi:prepilin-type N-terminal cleavage/methylation domain-containing protein